MQPQSNRLMDSKIYLFGASGHAKVVIDILKLREITPDILFDDNPHLDSLANIPVKHSVDMIISDLDKIFVTIGDNFNRKKIVVNYQFNSFNAIHPKAVVANSSLLGEGNCVMAGAIINSDIKIGNHCIINSGAVIEHDCILNDYVHISPNASLAGNVTVGEGAHVGIGASVIQGVKIGKWAVIGAGTVVLKDVPDYATVVGVPGKVISLNPQ